MATDDDFELIASEKPFSLVATIVVRASSHLVLPSCLAVAAKIAPNQIVKHAFLGEYRQNGRFCGYRLYYNKGTQNGSIGGNAGIHCEISIVDDCSQRHHGEEVEEALVDVRVIHLLACLREGVH